MIIFSFQSGSMPIPNRPIRSATHRYPTHQPQYGGLGLMPTVKLHQPDRIVLSEQNSNMVLNPVTVKIAPPDVLKPPVPRYWTLLCSTLILSRISCQYKEGWLVFGGVWVVNRQTLAVMYHLIPTLDLSVCLSLNNWKFTLSWEGNLII